MRTLPVRITLVLLLAAAGVGACTIPVFRYALDRWPADNFGLVAADDWKAGEAGRELAAAMRKGSPNLAWNETGTGQPGMALLWPDSGEVLWSGNPGAADVAAVLDSPARREMTDRILAGDSAVWVLVESGDAAKDEAFAKRLGARLKYLETVAAIPPQDPTDPDSRLGPGPGLQVGFSMIRVKKADPAEHFLVPMLAGPEGKALLEGGEPFAAPVFGRGRVLGAWKPADLDDAGIDEVSLFLLGACSCRVKTLNPGWDVLLSVNWDEQLMAVEFAREKDGGEEEQEGKP